MHHQYARALRAGRAALALMALAGPGLTPAAQADEPPPAQSSTPAYKIGFDYYTGWSNVTSFRRYFDGMWAGSAVAFPSVGYVRWDGPGQEAGKLSFGMGEMYDRHNPLLEQPVEGWWRVPVGKLTVTVGKHYVPFGVQEWEWETKPGAMVQWGENGWSVAASATHNFNTHAANGYLRVGKSVWSGRATVGLSAASGKGVTYDTSHTAAYAADLSAEWKGWQLTGEYVHAPTSAGDFNFHFGKLGYGRLGLLKPYVATYTWTDDSGQLGRFRASVYGLNVQIDRHIAVENGWAATSGGGKWWSQLHVTWEI